MTIHPRLISRSPNAAPELCPVSVASLSPSLSFFYVFLSLCLSPGVFMPLPGPGLRDPQWHARPLHRAAPLVEETEDTGIINFGVNRLATPKISFTALFSWLLLSQSLVRKHAQLSRSSCSASLTRSPPLFFPLFSNARACFFLEPPIDICFHIVPSISLHEFPHRLSVSLT